MILNRNYSPHLCVGFSRNTLALSNWYAHNTPLRDIFLCRPFFPPVECIFNKSSNRNFREDLKMVLIRIWFQLGSQVVFYRSLIVIAMRKRDLIPNWKLVEISLLASLFPAFLIAFTRALAASLSSRRPESTGWANRFPCESFRRLSKRFLSRWFATGAALILIMSFVLRFFFCYFAMLTVIFDIIFDLIFAVLVFNSSWKNLLQVKWDAFEVSGIDAAGLDLQGLLLSGLREGLAQVPSMPKEKIKRYVRSICALLLYYGEKGSREFSGFVSVWCFLRLFNWFLRPFCAKNCAGVLRFSSNSVQLSPTIPTHGLTARWMACAVVFKEIWIISARVWAT